MDLSSALNKIYSMHQFDIKLGLERIELLLEKIGNPHKDLKYFHIAGSNGKGSTASFIASILMESGYKVGLYTSPHLVSFNERIRIDRTEIPDEFIAEFITSIDNFITEIKPTFFEITTALAFKYFSIEKPDFVVLETGLGGRLDATNVVDPIASLITSISLEHTNILGDSIEKIAFEKAGIIKPKKPVFVGLLPEGALEVIRTNTDRNESQLFSLNDFIDFVKDHLSVHLRKKVYKIYKTGLDGYHQLVNSALAIKMLDELLKISDASIITKGLLNVVSNSGIQCRYEIFSEAPKIILDAAHNQEGVEAFAKEFQKDSAYYNKRILIFGAMRDKNIHSMLMSLSPNFDEIYITQASYERAASISEIIELNKSNNFNLIPLPEPIPKIESFLKGNPKECLVILGSIYLLGEIKLKILEKKLDKEKIEN
jgi:dihydrofolate synthase/folylpolyglutamate synthase